MTSPAPLTVLGNNRPAVQVPALMRRVLGFLVLGAALFSEGCRSTPAPGEPSGADGGAPVLGPLAPPPPEEIQFPSEGRTLRGVLYRPADPGRVPVIVYNHGSERDPSPMWLGDTGTFFQWQGFAILFPYRRGASGSEGPYWQDVVNNSPAAERDAATVTALEAENADVVAAVQWVRAQPFANPAAISVAGCSFGGIHTLLAAEKSLGLRAAVDFAGAAMTWSSNGALRDRLLQAARHARTPVFFLQAENDFDTTPSRALSEAMLLAGKPARLKIYPAQGATPMAGHAGFCNRAQRVWGDDVLAFLRAPLE